MAEILTLGDIEGRAVLGGPLVQVVHPVVCWTLTLIAPTLPPVQSLQAPFPAHLHIQKKLCITISSSQLSCKAMLSKYKIISIIGISNHLHVYHACLVSSKESGCRQDLSQICHLLRYTTPSTVEGQQQCFKHLQKHFVLVRLAQTDEN